MREERAGSATRFRAAGFFLLALVLWLTALSFGSSLLGLGKADTTARYLFSAGMELLLAVPAIIFMLIKRIAPSSLFGQAAPGQIALAALSGVLLVPASLGVAMLWNLLVNVTGGNIRPDDVPIPETGVQFLAAFAAVGLAAPAVEEPMMRGLLLNAGAGVMGRNKALLLVTAVFSLMHARFLGLPSIFLGGLLMGVLVWRSGSLWPAIAAHMAYNTTSVVLETLLHGVASANGLPAGAQAVPQTLELLAAAIVYILVSLPFVALCGVALWRFWRISPQAERPEPEGGKLPPSMSWPWVAAFILLLCYIAIDVFRVYGIIGV